MRTQASRLAALLVATVALAGCEPQSRQAAGPAPPESSTTTVAGVGFATPESVIHDVEADVYLVSNINGSPTGADDNGFISRVAPDGRVLELKWIDGAAETVELDAPKGLAIMGNVLYVADITRVRQFDRTTGRPLGTIEIPSSTFVNDVAAGIDGSLYVSDSGIAFSGGGTVDTGSAAIYRVLGDGTLEVVAEGSGLQRPNGIVHDPGRGLVMVPFGSSAVFSVSENGDLTAIVTLPAGGLDGVVATVGGSLLVSSWESGTVYEVTPETEIRELATNLPAPADLGFDAGRGRALVPLFNDDAVAIIPIPVAGTE